MNSAYFRVLYEGVVLAERMSLETAVILVKALFQEWWNEPDAKYTIEKMKTEEADEWQNDQA